MPRNDSITDDDLRQLESGADEQFNAVAARFVAIDSRFIALGHRVGAIEERLQQLDRTSERRCDEIDRRIDAAQSRLDNVRLVLAAQIDQAHRDLRQVVLLGLIGTVISTAMLCLGTVVLVL
jgi:hypothetical protein